MPAPNEITTPQLLRLIGTPDCPALVDICIEADHLADPYLIPGSFRHNFNDISGLVERLNGQPCVIICQKGKKLSQGLTAWLNSDGINAQYLKGGRLAWIADQAAPRIAAKAHPIEGTSPSIWVTRHRPKIDRIACPWLIQRFVDPKARFLFVAPSEVQEVANRFGAQPFDIEGVHWSHRGELCTFDVMLDEFGLRTKALDELSLVIRAADTNRHDLHPAAAGLLAVSVGLSKQYRNDVEQLRAGLNIYDALYLWARDGQSEQHDWPNSRGNS
ncbi:MAG: sulfurtransferase/chromate resistance protein [Paracoccaceae bacterium]|nr:sulfurtransferase/chromate resistance protein [Paracoccaceae bacterium]MDG2259221.1 sulfurtransferase/chromate resistance protein [Paracoccaceae bacterium]